MKPLPLMYCIAALMMLALTTAGCRDHLTSTANGATAGQETTPRATRFVGGLQEPVSLAFLNNHILLVAERRAGRIRWVEDGTLRDAPFATVQLPTVSGYNEFGLLGLAVDPDYPTRPFVYAFHTVAGPGGRPNGQRIVRFTVQDGRGVNPQTIVGNLPASTGCCHNGGRIRFGGDDKLYVTIGDTMRPELAQDYSSLAGKVLRYNPDGTVPGDNPFEPQNTVVSDDGQRTEQRTPVFTVGHRNPFGIAVSETGDIYITENGPDRNDEINRLAVGDNYGWPEVMGPSNNPRFHAPLWASGNSTIAPTGAVFYTGDAFPQYRGNLLFAAYNDGRLRRAIFAGPDRIERVEVIAEAGTNARLDVALSPDGTLYYASNDAIYRLRSAEK